METKNVNEAFSSATPVASGSDIKNIYLEDKNGKIVKATPEMMASVLGELIKNNVITINQNEIAKFTIKYSEYCYLAFNLKVGNGGIITNNNYYFSHNKVVMKNLNSDISIAFQVKYIKSTNTLDIYISNTNSIPIVISNLLLSSLSPYIYELSNQTIVDSVPEDAVLVQ